MALVVLKFGGTSVGDAAAIERVAAIVGRETRPRLVVVSALSGVTNLLVALGVGAGDGDRTACADIIDRLRTRHATLLAAVASERERATVTPHLEAIVGRLQAVVASVPPGRAVPPRTADAIHACGELLSSHLVAAALRARGVDAVRLDATAVLITDAGHGRAQPDVAATRVAARAAVRAAHAAHQVPVIGGYIGATAEGVTTTLGRGGSDYSAAIFGAVLEAEEIQIWTDVDGMLTADPRIVPAARRVPRLSYAEAAELAYFGATVLHPSTVQPAVRDRIPVRILNTANAAGAGTLITATADDGAGPIAALASKRGLTVVEITSARMLMAHGFLARLFEVFDRWSTAVDVVTTSEVSVSVTVDDASRLGALADALREFAEVTVTAEMAIVCLVGERLHRDPGVLPRIVAALGTTPVQMVSLSAARRNVTFVVPERHLAGALGALHRRFFEPAEPHA